ncbi:hypothetical protein SAMN05444409_0447 [Epilithonimonas zeae]|uniref:Uncharacterized protein n=2 Tax=Epilithonimonas zeae TaxID=1416779 RepID=A0A1N6EBB2_9FLAO|nr:hypothetical protein SAMN05444409_0447 [Epilithonimonas zeae]
MYEKKKTLVKTAFEQAEKELKKENVSKNYLAGYLSTHFEGLFGSAKTDKMFERYYTDLVQKNKNRYIDEITLDQLSKYLGYKDYEDFCKNFIFTKKINDSTTLKFSIDDEEQSLKGTNFSFTLFNSPVFNLQEFLTKQSNLGIIGAILCGGLFVGNKMYKADEKKPEIETNRNRLGLLVATKQCMYWNGKEYVPEDCNQTKNNLIAIDPKKVANFKKITQPDTISSIKNIWYSKYQNEVEFFTDNGINPENGSDLRPLTPYILEKYTVREE